LRTPDRYTRDAEAAARSVLSGQATAEPKTRDGIVESIRVLRNTRASAVKARTQAILHVKNLIVTAPDELRESLVGLTNRQLVRRRGGSCPAAAPTRSALAGSGASSDRRSYVAEKVGFQREGVLRSHLRHPDGYRPDSVFFSLLPGELSSNGAAPGRLSKAVNFSRTYRHR
jgi:hypothetical protein